ncbi:uncharacterized protein APUU_51483S [Aspergillus puulaauensis]|uniref:Uncharacterized protein n=1 Tax=Aspergillus puulaauensis TaxID=1220207 RepID=A0A7R8AQ79_9EURO|nr:uncharacterized protein APUU_51483S [Aspergillus puulaauensis]BCS26772.1 hypothetical protein APUU_51483S [Aspergillus puulaauensis]
MRPSTLISAVVALFAVVAFTFPTASIWGLKSRANAGEPIIPSHSIYNIDLDDVEPLARV